MHKEHMMEREDCYAHALMKLFACIPTLPDMLFILSHHNEATMANFSGSLRGVFVPRLAARRQSWYRDVPSKVLLGMARKQP